MCSEAEEMKSFWGGIIIHLDCRSPDILKGASLFTPHDRRSVSYPSSHYWSLWHFTACCLATWIVSRAFYNAPWRDVQSWPCMLPLLVTAHQVKTDWDKAAVHRLWAQTRRRKQMHSWTFTEGLSYWFICFIVPGKSHKEQPYKIHIINKKPR